MDPFHLVIADELPAELLITLVGFIHIAAMRLSLSNDMFLGKFVLYLCLLVTLHVCLCDISTPPPYSPHVCRCQLH